MPTTLLVISAPSGAGKTTLCQRLMKDFSSIVLSISSTTRERRWNEQEGRDYFFLSKDEFQRRIDAGRFAEWAIVHDNFYGTSKDFIESAFSDGKSLLLDIDVQGAESLRKAYPEQTLRIFISPPSIQTLEERLLGRGTDDARAIQKRLANARREMEQSREFDHIVINDSLDRAYAELKGIVENRIGPNG